MTQFKVGDVVWTTAPGVEELRRGIRVRAPLKVKIMAIKDAAINGFTVAEIANDSGHWHLDVTAEKLHAAELEAQRDYLHFLDSERAALDTRIGTVEERILALLPINPEIEK